MLDVKGAAEYAPMRAEAKFQPLDEEATEELNNLIGYLNSLLDGTGC